MTRGRRRPYGSSPSGRPHKRQGRHLYPFRLTWIRFVQRASRFPQESCAVCTASSVPGEVANPIRTDFALRCRRGQMRMTALEPGHSLGQGATPVGEQNGQGVERREQLARGTERPARKTTPPRHDCDLTSQLILNRGTGRCGDVEVSSNCHRPVDDRRESRLRDQSRFPETERVAGPVSPERSETEAHAPTWNKTR